LPYRDSFQDSPSCILSIVVRCCYMLPIGDFRKQYFLDNLILVLVFSATCQQYISYFVVSGFRKKHDIWMYQVHVCTPNNGGWKSNTQTLVVVGTDCICTCKPNNHMIAAILGYHTIAVKPDYHTSRPRKLIKYSYTNGLAGVVINTRSFAYLVHKPALCNAYTWSLFVLNLIACRCVAYLVLISFI